MKGEGLKSLVLSESLIILKYAMVRQVQGRLSCDAGGKKGSQFSSVHSR